MKTLSQALLVTAASILPLFIVECVMRWPSEESIADRSENSRGPEPTSSRTSVLVLGDSFAEGAGLADRHRRFSDQLQRRLALTHHITTLAKGGWDTKAEYVALFDSGIVPKVLVLSYYPNDIDSAASHHGVSYVRTEVTSLPVISRAGRWLKSHSRLAAWILRRFPREERGTYREYLRRAFEEAPVWNEHVEDLDAITAWTRRHGVRLVVVLFPFLVDLEFSAPVLGRVASHFRERGIETLDVTGLVAGMPLRERIVSEEDPHASAEVHRRLADALANRIAAFRGTAAKRSDAPKGG